jgi:hypothetical protein
VCGFFKQLQWLGVAKIRKVFYNLLIFNIIFATTIAYKAPKALAICPPSCVCIALGHVGINAVVDDRHESTRDHITEQFINHRVWWREVYWKKHIGAAMMLMTEQLSAVMMYQMKIVGALFDAKHQLETLAIFDEQAAEAIIDYTPSQEVCTIGTSARSLAASETLGEFNALHLAKKRLDRQLLRAGSTSGGTSKFDKTSRLDHFKWTYCDVRDNNDNLRTMCGNGAREKDRINKDINYTRTIGAPLTLNLNYARTPPTRDEEDVMALGTNLYAHDLFRNINTDLFEDTNGPGQLAYLDTRSVMAKRSVAESSYNAIAALKTKGTVTPGNGNTYNYMALILSRLGITEGEDIVEVIGHEPSYYAQMELLTKKIYQRPEFYTNLYDKPANVDRVAAAMRAISLMQNMDMFESHLRSEAMMAVLLEMKIMEQHEAINNRIAPMRATGRRF